MNKYVKKLFELFDTKNYKYIEYDKIKKRHVFQFEIDNYKYLCYLNNMTLNSYYLSFCLIDENNIEKYNIINDENIQKFKVFGNVKNIVDDFIKNKNIDFLGFVCLENERQWLYIDYGKYLASTFNMNLFSKRDKNRTFYWVSSKNIGNFLLKTYEKELLRNSEKSNK